MKQRVWQGAAAVLALVTMVLVWTEVLEDRLLPKRWGVVEAGSIYRSGQLHPALVKETLADNNINVIVNLNKWRPDKASHAAEQRAAAELGITSSNFPLRGDGTGEVENYVQALVEIDRSVKTGQRVLVHCTAGSQRTGGAIAFYRVLLQGRTPEQALREMIAYDFDLQDDLALLSYLDDNVDHVARRLNDLGVSTGAPELSGEFARAAALIREDS